MNIENKRKIIGYPDNRNRFSPLIPPKFREEQSWPSSGNRSQRTPHNAVVSLRRRNRHMNLLSLLRRSLRRCPRTQALSQQPHWTSIFTQHMPNIGWAVTTPRHNQGFASHESPRFTSHRAHRLRHLLR